MAIEKGLRSSSYIWNESLRDIAAKNNKIILGRIISRASRNKVWESPTLLCVSQIPWVQGLVLGTHQEARAKQENITECLLCGRTMQDVLHIFSHFTSG